MVKRAARKLLACWGNGDFGRLGHGAACLSEELPRVVSSLADCTLTAVACGSAHTAVLGDDGSVYTMGLNDAGQLGHSHGFDSVSEPREMLLPEAIVGVAAGGQHTLLLAESGSVWATGSNSRGQLGLGKSAPAASLRPHRIPALAGGRVVHIAAGAEHSLAVTDSGELLTWGAGAHGQLGHGRAAIPLDRDEPTPRAVLSVTGEAITHAAAGMLHSGSVSEGGRVWMWGDIRFWQLGIPASRQASEPTQVELRGVTQIALSGHHTLALRHSGELYAWGANENGVLGLGKEGRISVRLPTLVPGAAFEQVACGWKHCAGITAAGDLFCWGWGGSQGSSTAFAPMKSAGGQLGLGNDFDYWQPTRVQQLLYENETLANSENKEQQWTARQVSCGLNHTAAIVEVPE